MAGEEDDTEHALVDAAAAAAKCEGRTTQEDPSLKLSSCVIQTDSSEETEASAPTSCNAKFTPSATAHNSSASNSNGSSGKPKTKMNKSSSSSFSSSSFCSFASRIFAHNHDSFVFALRMMVATTAASLFMLAFPLDNPWPQASWIYVTACVVAWQPNIDSANVVIITALRTLGTVVGVALAVGVGFVSLEIATVTGQAIFMAVILAAHGFCYPYVCDRLGWRTNHAASFGNLTFGVILFGFFNTTRFDRPWRVGIYRVVNIYIGCAIVALCAVIVCPISTKQVIVDKIKENINAVGKSSEMVLERAVSVALGRSKPEQLDNILPFSNDDDADDDTTSKDELYETYVKGVEDWKKCMDLFANIKYDPWFWRLSKEQQRKFRKHMIGRLARSSRIQNSLVTLDSMTRTELEYGGPKDSLDIVQSVGQRTRIVLDFSVDQVEREAATRDLLEKDLVCLRARMARMTEATPFASKVDVEAIQRMLSEESSSGGLPLSPVDTRGEQSILFFSLVEHLILRVARLHYYCLEYNAEDE